MLTLSGNPVLSTPDGARLDEALLGLDFMAAVDIYLNETTRHADVILPPTSALERDHYDLVFQPLAVRNTARFTPAVFAKPKRRSARLGDLPRDRAAHDGAARPQAAVAQAAQGAGAAVAEPDADHRRAAAPRSFRRHAAPAAQGARGSRPRAAAARPAARRGCPTKSKRIDAAPGLVIDDLARLRAAPAPEDDELLLIGRRHKQDCNSWMHNAERLTRGKPRHQLFMHPDDLAARGIDDGATVAVTSRVGKVEVDVLATDDVMPGVVSLPHGYGHQVGGTRMTNAETVVGVSINDLTDPERLDVSGNAALSGVPVTVAGSGPEPDATFAARHAYLTCMRLFVAALLSALLVFTAAPAMADRITIKDPANDHVPPDGGSDLDGAGDVIKVRVDHAPKRVYVDTVFRTEPYDVLEVQIDTRKGHPGAEFLFLKTPLGAHALARRCRRQAGQVRRQARSSTCPKQRTWAALRQPRLPAVTRRATTPRRVRVRLLSAQRRLLLHAGRTCPVGTTSPGGSSHN